MHWKCPQRLLNHTQKERGTITLKSRSCPQASDNELIAVNQSDRGAQPSVEKRAEVKLGTGRSLAHRTNIQWADHGRHLNLTKGQRSVLTEEYKGYTEWMWTTVVHSKSSLQPYFTLSSTNKNGSSLQSFKPQQEFQQRSIQITQSLVNHRQEHTFPHLDFIVTLEIEPEDVELFRKIVKSLSQLLIKLKVEAQLLLVSELHITSHIPHPAASLDFLAALFRCQPLLNQGPRVSARAPTQQSSTDPCIVTHIPIALGLVPLFVVRRRLSPEICSKFMLSFGHDQQSTYATASSNQRCFQTENWNY
ncbi:hypothetical protein CBL_05525 [Carabus blaptoides fortunei]